MIMVEEARAILAIAARLLSYPGESFDSERQEVENWIQEGNPSDETKAALTTAVASLQKFSLQELQEVYVDAFDWKEKTGLYLTAHEFGDDRKRGAALIKLQKIVNDAGFERVEGELSDYMPMLFELMAVSDETSLHDKLHRRLACATYRVAGAIGDDHPYKPVIALLTKFVFETPTKDEMEKMGEDKEGADPDPMPFPIMYE